MGPYVIGSFCARLLCDGSFCDGFFSDGTLCKGTDPEVNTSLQVGVAAIVCNDPLSPWEACQRHG
jgi:hypothetical protein